MIAQIRVEHVAEEGSARVGVGLYENRGVLCMCVCLGMLRDLKRNSNVGCDELFIVGE